MLCHWQDWMWTDWRATEGAFDPCAQVEASPVGLPLGGVLGIPLNSVLAKFVLTAFFSVVDPLDISDAQRLF